jgi:5-hydroxyisourate hydrolase
MSRTIYWTVIRGVKNHRAFAAATLSRGLGEGRPHKLMGKLTTHVLDTSAGTPAAGMRIDFASFDGKAARNLRTVYTNAEGRIDEPLLAADAMHGGEFELTFHVADYFRARGHALAEPPFLDRVPIRFAIADATAHYHVPLLCSPWAYSTYRGS